MPLKQYKDAVGMFAACATIIQLLSPTVLCSQIIKKRNTRGIPFIHLAGGLVLSSMLLRTGFMLNEHTMITVNMIGVSLGVAYVLLYLIYTESKKQTISSISKTIIFIGAMLAYSMIERQDVVHFRFGLATTAVMLSLIGSPLLSIGTILKKGDASSLPIPMIITGTVVTSSWLLFGVIIEEAFLQVQSGIGLTLNLIQIMLYVAYRPSSKKVDSKKSN